MKVAPDINGFFDLRVPLNLNDDRIAITLHGCTPGSDGDDQGFFLRYLWQRPVEKAVDSPARVGDENVDDWLALFWDVNKNIGVRRDGAGSIDWKRFEVGAIYAFNTGGIGTAYLGYTPMLETKSLELRGNFGLMPLRFSNSSPFVALNYQVFVGLILSQGFTWELGAGFETYITNLGGTYFKPNPQSRLDPWKERFPPPSFCRVLLGFGEPRNQ